MPAEAYKSLPTLVEWRKEISTGGIGKPAQTGDPVLATIDRLVGGLEHMELNKPRTYMLGELFFSTMWWLNHFKDKPQKDLKLRTAVLRLNLCAANKLALILWCSLHELPQELQEIYGVEMTQHGYAIDSKEGADKAYLTAQQREDYRVIFRKGLAYWIRKPVQPGQEPKLVPWDWDENVVDRGNRQGIGFVMSMSGELFIAKWGSVVSFHSSFMGGLPVMCAGTVCLTKGQITRLCNDSGHYKPVDESLAKVLRRLQMLGVNLSLIKVVGEQSGKEARGDTFLAANANWDRILASGTRARGGQVLA
jgi:hypothetical protein